MPPVVTVRPHSNLRRSLAVIIVATSLAVVGCTGSQGESDPTSSSPSTSTSLVAVGQECVPAAPETAVSAGVEVQVEVHCSTQSGSSVTRADLNADGVAEMILGFRGGASGGLVAAFDSVKGTQLWSASVTGDVITPAQVAPINTDAVPDVIVATRSDLGESGVPPGDLAAIDGSTGTILWHAAALTPPWQNIYTPRPVGDRNGDGIGDWLVVTGGDQQRQPFVEPTLAARVVVISGRDGAVMGALPLPKMQESYNTPLVAQVDGKLVAFIGSGGETLGGSVWRITVDDLVANRAAGFVEVLTNQARGFIGPGVVATSVGSAPTVVVQSMTGRVSAIDGSTSAVKWAVEPVASPQLPGAVMSASSALAVGQLDSDPQPEIVVSVLSTTTDNLVGGQLERGDLTISVLDSVTGATQAQRSLINTNSISSPRLVDQDGAGISEVMCACVVRAPGPDDADVNGATTTSQVLVGGTRVNANLALWNPRNDQVNDLGLRAATVVTPMVEALDGTLDIVSVYELPRGAGFVLIRSRVKLPAPSVAWPGYLGLGVYKTP